jgi:tetratricopeptide (TPR) repeat protein
MMDRLTEIKNKLELLKKYDVYFSTPGSKVHRHELKPVLTEEVLKEFERAENILLPTDYKSFLLCIGNGGVGPGTGLYSLQESRNGAGWYAPLTDLNGIENSNYPGQLLICHHGCGQFTWYRTTTDHKGEIWLDNRVLDEKPLSKELGFLDWYEWWLNSVYLEFGFITYLGGDAYQLAQSGNFTRAIELFRILVDFDLHDTRISIPAEIWKQILVGMNNALHYLQNANSGLPVNRELNLYFLEKCLPYTHENPAIYHNAACLYSEMGDFNEVLECIEWAKKNYDGYEMMIQEIRQDPVFLAFRNEHPQFNLA